MSSSFCYQGDIAATSWEPPRQSNGLLFGMKDQKTREYNHRREVKEYYSYGCTSKQMEQSQTLEEIQQARPLKPPGAYPYTIIPHRTHV